jgi:hypothetical protein
MVSMAPVESCAVRMTGQSVAIWIVMACRGAGSLKDGGAVSEVPTVRDDRARRAEAEVSIEED